MVFVADVGRAMKLLLDGYDLKEYEAEIRYRAYARRTGEHACEADHETLEGKCPSCQAQV